MAALNHHLIHKYDGSIDQAIHKLLLHIRTLNLCHGSSGRACSLMAGCCTDHWCSKTMVIYVSNNHCVLVLNLTTVCRSPFKNEFAYCTCKPPEWEKSCGQAGMLEVIGGPRLTFFLWYVYQDTLGHTRSKTVTSSSNGEAWMILHLPRHPICSLHATFGTSSQNPAAKVPSSSLREDYFHLSLSPSHPLSPIQTLCFCYYTIYTKFNVCPVSI